MKHPNARRAPGKICTANGIRHEADPETYMIKLLVEILKNDKNGDLLSRVKNPAQKPKTTPRTIASCSSDMSEPRISGGLISAMYKGESMLSM